MIKHLFGDSLLEAGRYRWRLKAYAPFVHVESWTWTIIPVHMLRDGLVHCTKMMKDKQALQPDREMPGKETATP